jgi:exo-beta-1,3-glucanase (GH17 family)
MRQVLLAPLSACEGFVYANMYAYFDPNVAGQIGRNASQASFTQAVANSMTGSLAALRNAFAGQNVSTEVRIGETGWPTPWRAAGPAERLPRQRPAGPVVCPGHAELVGLERCEDDPL